MNTKYLLDNLILREDREYYARADKHHHPVIGWYQRESELELEERKDHITFLDTFLTTHRERLVSCDLIWQALHKQYADFKQTVQEPSRHGHSGQKNMTYILEQLLDLYADQFEFWSWRFSEDWDQLSEEQKARNRRWNAWIYQLLAHILTTISTFEKGLQFPIQILRSDWIHRHKKLLLKPYRWDLPPMPYNPLTELERAPQSYQQSLDRDLAIWGRKFCHGLMMLQLQYNWERMRHSTWFDAINMYTLWDSKPFPSSPHNLCGMIRRPVLTLQPWNALYALEGVNEGLTQEWTHQLGWDLIYTDYDSLETDLAKEGVVIPTGAPYKRVFIPAWKRQQLMREVE